MSGAAFGLRRFATGRLLAGVSDQCLLFAVPLAIFKSTGEVKYSGLAFIIEWLPRILFLPLAGFCADRMTARHLFFGVEAGRALCVAGALVLISQGLGTFAALALMMGAMSVAYNLNFVATEALLPRNLPADRLPGAHALLQSVDQVAQVAGPLLATLISLRFGLHPVLMFSAALFAGAALLLRQVDSAPVATGTRFTLAALVASNRTAFKVLMEHKILFHLSALTWVVKLIYGAALVVSASVVLKVLALPEPYFGLLQSCAAVTSLLVFALVPATVRRYGLSRLGTASFCAMILAGLLLALASNFALYLAAYAILMACDGAFNVYIRTLRSRIIPLEHMGKTSGLIGMMNMCSVPMSAAAVTLLSVYLPPSGIFGAIFALAALAGLALVLFGRRTFGHAGWLPAGGAP